MSEKIEVRNVSPRDDESTADWINRCFWDGQRHSLRNRIWRVWRKVTGFPSTAKWWFLHRFVPRHRYHVVRTDLPPGYHDPDARILHATFTLVREYVDNNREWKVIDWDANEDQRAVWAELNALRDWWAVDRPATLREIERTWQVADSYAARQAAHDMEKALHAQEGENLIRVVKIRDALWYA